jgi:hypothetical protein
MTQDNGSQPGAALSPLAAKAALDAHFLEARSKLLDLAAILDRIDRGGGSVEIQDDPRLHKIRQALEVLHDEDNRAERIQQLFSLDYDPSWERPQPR